MYTWYQRLLFGLFRPRPPRPNEGEASLAEIATVIVQLIRTADRANGLMGKDHLLSFFKQLQSGPVGATTDLREWSFYFEPKPAPLGPDFRFEFENDRVENDTIHFRVWGSYRYEGFFLSGKLKPVGSRNAREEWPTPFFSVSAEPGLTLAVTRHAKRLRDFFINNYGAKDYEAMLKAFR